MMWDYSSRESCVNRLCVVIHSERWSVLTPQFYRTAWYPHFVVVADWNETIVISKTILKTEERWSNKTGGKIGRTIRYWACGNRCQMNNDSKTCVLRRLPKSLVCGENGTFSVRGSESSSLCQPFSKSHRTAKSVWLKTGQWQVLTAAESILSNPFVWCVAFVW